MEKYYSRIERGGNTSALVFVHGILGHWKQTWGEFPNLVLQDSALNHCDIICWGYPSGLLIPKVKLLGFLGNRLPYIGYKVPDVNSVADALATDLSNPEIGGSYSDLILIGHSMGGLVVMRTIISALSKVPEDTALLDRLRRIVLYATPSDGVQLPAVLKFHPQAKSIICDQGLINELRNQWITRVHTVRQDEAPQQGKRHIPVTAVIGLEDNAVPRGSAAAYLTDVVTAAGNHTELCKPESREHTSFQVLKRVVKESAIVRRADSQDHSAVTAAVPTVTADDKREPVAMTEAAKEDKPSSFVAGLEEAEKGNFQEAYNLFEKASLEETDSATGLGSLALGCFHLYGKGWAEGFRRLKKLAAEHPSVATIHSWLALAYTKTAQWQEAVDSYKKWRDLSAAGSDRIIATKRLAACLVLAGRDEEALSELRAALDEAQDPPDKAEVYKALGDTLLKVRKSEPLLGIACYEKALSLEPTSTELRFDLAYKHGETISPSASLYHYKKILEMGRHQWAANNAGVRAKELGLPLTSIDYFTAAAEQNNTLAMSNMAASLIDAGFEKLAKGELEKARQQSDVHENVDLNLGRIQRERLQEKKKLEELDEKVAKIIRWRRLEADAIAQSPIQPSALVGEYRQADNTLLKMNCHENGTILGEAKGSDELLTFSGRIEGVLLRFAWKTVPVENPISALQPTSLLGFGLRQPASGTGVLMINRNRTTLNGYRVKSDAPIDPIEWNLSRVNSTGP